MPVLREILRSRLLSPARSDYLHPGDIVEKQDGQPGTPDALSSIKAEAHALWTADSFMCAIDWARSFCHVYRYRIDAALLSECSVGLSVYVHHGCLGGCIRSHHVDWVPTPCPQQGKFQSIAVLSTQSSL